jgi:hypothetical protein
LSIIFLKKEKIMPVAKKKSVAKKTTAKRATAKKAVAKKKTASRAKSRAK